MNRVIAKVGFAGIYRIANVWGTWNVCTAEMVNPTCFAPLSVYKAPGSRQHVLNAASRKTGRSFRLSNEKAVVQG
jgi:hypothetical protein